MNKFIKISISTITAVIVLGSFASVAFAQTTPPLFVTFSANPLFSETNFVPGNNKEASITIVNNTNTSQSAYIEAVNISNGDNLASQMQLEMFDGSNPASFYNDNFGTFLNAGPILLSSIDAGGSGTYNLKITFLESAGNDYQGKTLGFDICVGFSGGDQTCTNTITVGPEQNSGGGNGGGGGGVSSGQEHLVISNENASNLLANGATPDSGTATITWDTNILSTSQVIYGLSSGSPYTLNLNILPGLGYPFNNAENLTKTFSHSMLLTGLTPGATYVYRVVSRASPPTVSYEHQFTVPVQPASAPLGISGGGVQGEILGANTENGATSTASASSISNNGSNLAAAFAAGGLSLWWWLLLVLILIVYLVWRFVFKKQNE